MTEQSVYIRQPDGTLRPTSLPPLLAERIAVYRELAKEFSLEEIRLLWPETTTRP